MAPKQGVFIRSSRSENEVIEACKQLINRSSPGGKITALKKDEAHGGYKVYLNGADAVSEVLKKRYLDTSGDHSDTVHALTTHLTVHDAIFSTTEESFIQELEGKIGEVLGPVQTVRKIPISEQHPDIGTGDWRVVIDVPEVDALDVFTRNGLPDDFMLPLSSVSDSLCVTFHCRLCGGDGHTQWMCTDDVLGARAEMSPASQPGSRVDESPHPADIKPASGFESAARDPNSQPDGYARFPLKKIRKIESEIGREEARRYCGLSEGDGEDSNDMNSVLDTKFRSTFNPSSTTNDDTPPEIVYESMPSTSVRQHSKSLSVPSRGVSLTIRNSAEDSVSTSNQPEAIVDTIKPELVFPDDDVESDSNPGKPCTPKQTVRKRKKPAQGVPIVIPDRIKEIINGIDKKVLNVGSLEAFFNHVKKKSKPCNIATHYTSDVAGLKRQLEEISRQYYHTPDRGTNAEIQFMKWFNTTLQRFDGAVSSRRSTTTE